MRFQTEIEDIHDAKYAIKNAWIAGAISGGLTFILSAIAISQGGALLEGLVDGWAIIDATITLGLTVGVYRRSRAAAVGLLAFYLINQIYMRLSMGLGSGVIIAMLFTFFFVQGVRGTFAYHRFIEEEKAVDLNTA